MIEPKNVNAFEIDNCLHVIMASNNDWVVPASADERRYAVFDVSDARLGELDYFKKLNEELDGGGLAAMLHDLLGMDLGEWHPREDVPQTEALRRQKVLSLKGVAGIVFGFAEAGVLPEPHRVLGKPNVVMTSGEDSGRGWGGGQAGRRLNCTTKTAAGLRRSLRSGASPTTSPGARGD